MMFSYVSAGLFRVRRGELHPATIRTTLEARAPSAMRTPISRVRCPTKQDRTP